jgi:hypothetical protein
VNTKVTAEDVIELFLKGMERESQSAMDFMLYEIHATAENVITYERPMSFSEIPLLVAAQTPETEIPAKFLIVPRSFVSYSPLEFQQAYCNSSLSTD